MRYRAGPMSERIECSVLVPVFNEERYIARTVAAMQRQQSANGHAPGHAGPVRSPSLTGE
jgi:hypothetical protein